MIKRFFTILFVLLTCALSAVESKFDYSKAVFRSYPKDSAISLENKVNNKNRVLTFRVDSPKGLSSIYTYIPVKSNQKYTLSFDYKLSNFATIKNKKAASFVQVHFLDKKGKEVKTAKPHKFAIQLKNTNNKYTKAETSFTVPSNVARVQVVLLSLNNIAGKFEITNVNFVPASTQKVTKLLSAYSVNASWSTWPRNKSISVSRSKDRRMVTFNANSPGDNAGVYTYLTLQKNITYAISFKVTSQKVIKTPGASATCVLDFQTNAGKNSGDASIQWKLDLPSLGQSKEYNFEFTTPNNSQRARMHVIRLKSMGGTFVIKDLHVEPIIDRVIVPKTTSKITCDGKLNEAIWKKSNLITRFYIFGTNKVQEVNTNMYLTYDDKNLYLGVQCFEPFINKILVKETKHDSPVWADDSIEFFLAAPNNRAMQLVFNTIGGKFDSELYQRVPGDPWRGAQERNYTWQTKVVVAKDNWTGELVLPFKELGITPKAGQKWRLNLVRSRRVPHFRNSAQWNMQTGDLKNVDKFATLEFNKNHAILTRFREEMLDDPLKVERKVEYFANLPRKATGKYQVYNIGSFLLNSYSAKFKKENASTWPLRQKKMLEEMKDATCATPIGYPWLSCFGTKEELLSLLKKNNWKFTCNLHNSSQDRLAIKQGATLKVKANLVNCADELLHKITIAWGHERFKKDAWIIPHLAWICSTDEPTNTLYESFSVTKNTSKVKELNQISKEIQKTHGFGKYGLFDNFASNDDKDAPFRRIAFLSYWNDKVISLKKRERALAKHYAPNVPFMAVNAFNTVSTFRGIEVFPNFAGVSDITCVDPYPTSTLAQCGRNRALHHTGFSAKTLSDMNQNNLTGVYVQAFNYCGRAPNKENLREWASQALKNGANIIRWYTDGNIETAPGCYEELIRLSKIISKMKVLALPEKSPVGIFYSFISHWGNFDIEQNAEYALYSIMGEKLKGNFKFISDFEVADNRTKIGDYKVVIAPNLKYLTPIVADKLVKYVQAGGRLIILDAEAFAFATNGKVLTAIRQKLIGSPIGKVRSDTSILLNGKVATVEAAFSVKLPKDAKVVATYLDKSPAAFERKVGKGSIVYFASVPFRSARQITNPGQWGVYLAKEMKSAGERLDHKFWDFMLPKAK